jgi:hypothetical protein
MTLSESAAASGTERHDCAARRRLASPGHRYYNYRQQQHYAFATFKDLLLFGNGEHPQLVQLEYFYKTLIKSLLTNDNQNSSSRLRCVSPSLYLFRDLYANNCHQVTLMFTTFRASTSSSKHSEYSTFPLALRSTRIVFLSLKRFSSELETEAKITLTLLINSLSASLILVSIGLRG